MEINTARETIIPRQSAYPTAPALFVRRMVEVVGCLRSEATKARLTRTCGRTRLLEPRVDELPLVGRVAR